MGKRRLAYIVRKFHDGIYVLLTVEGGGGLIHELERRLRVTEPVIKFLTVRIDEEQKRLDKIKAIRDAKRKSRSARATALRPRGKRRRQRHRNRRWSFAVVVGQRESTPRTLTTNDQRPTTDLRSIMADETRATASESSSGGDRPGSRRTASVSVRVDRGRRSRGWRRGRTQVFPPQEGLQVLRRENRGHQLQGRSSAGAVRGGERKNRAPASDRRVHAAPATLVFGDQAGAQYRVAAVCRPRSVKSRPRIRTDFFVARLIRGHP